MVKRGNSSVAVQRGETLVAKLRNYSSKAETAVEKAILKGALIVEGDAKRRCPVDTGYLRASITHQFFNNGSTGEPFALVGSNVEYAPHQEYGTSKMSAQPFLRPAFEQNIAAIKSAVKEAAKL